MSATGASTTTSTHQESERPPAASTIAKASAASAITAPVRWALCFVQPCIAVLMSSSATT